MYSPCLAYNLPRLSSARDLASLSSLVTRILKYIRKCQCKNKLGRRPERKTSFPGFSPTAGNGVAERNNVLDLQSLTGYSEFKHYPKR